MSTYDFPRPPPVPSGSHKYGNGQIAVAVPEGSLAGLASTNGGGAKT